MPITVKRYRATDFPALDQMEIQLQDFLTKIDPLKRIRRGPGFSPKYSQNIVTKVKENRGAIFIAFDGKKPVGCIAGIIEKQTAANLLELIPTVSGRILELFVMPDYRKHGVGTLLMEKMESYFRQKKCDVIRIEVFAPNKVAHEFYHSKGYQDRLVDVIKKI